MVGKDDHKDAFIVPPEARDFVRKRDQKKCLLCGAGNTMPDPVLIVAGSPWDEIEVSMVGRDGVPALTPGSLNGSRNAAWYQTRSTLSIRRTLFHVSPTPCPPTACAK